MTTKFCSSTFHYFMVLLLLMQYLEASFPKDRKKTLAAAEEDNEGKKCL